MKISPLDIRKQTFRTAFRGADSEEVRVFLDLVATEYESALQENAQLAERLHHCEDRLVEYRELDQTLRNSLLTAERLSAEAKESAQHEGEIIIQDAEWRAKQMLEDARERLGRLAEEIRDLQSKKDSFSQHLRSFLQAQMDLLDRNEDYLDGIDRLAEEIHGMASRARHAQAEVVSPQTTEPAASQTEPAAPPSREDQRSEELDLDTPSIGEPDPMSEEAEVELEVRTPEQQEESTPPTPERSEGLFEISADEDSSPTS